MKQYHASPKENTNLHHENSHLQVMTSNLNSRFHKQTVNQTDVDMLEKFYLTEMLSIYLKNKKKYPNPHQILQSLRIKQRKLEQNEKSLIVYRQHFKQNQHSAKSQSKTEQSQDNKRIQELVKRKINQQYSKIRYKYLTILQQNMNSSQFFIKYSLTQNQNILNFILQSFTQIMRKHKLNFKAIEQKWRQRQVKKIQFYEDRFQKQSRSKTQEITRLSNKIKEIQEEYGIHKDQYKQAQKQKNSLYAQIYKNHQQIIEKSNTIQRLRQRVQKNQKTIQNLQNVIQSNKKIISQQEIQISQITLSKIQFQQNIKQHSTNYRKLQEQNTKLKKKIQQQLQIKLSKIKSQQNFYNKSSNSGINFNAASYKYKSNKEIRLQDVPSYEQQILRLKQQIGIMQKKLTDKDELLCHQRQQWSQRQKDRLQKIIEQWKAQLEKLILQTDSELRYKDSLILNLKDEIAYLKSQQRNGKNKQQNDQKQVARKSSQQIESQINLAVDNL